MQVPLQISLHGIAPSDALYNAIRERAQKLEHFFGRITSCRVVLELAARHKRHGKQFRVHIDLKIAGREIVITHEHDEDLQIALRGAFRAARRQLEDGARERRGDVKQHAPVLAGRVERLDAEQGFGFIVDADGRDFYFSRENVVKPDFEQLAVGTPVHFIEEAAGEGLQAKRVTAHGRQPPAQAR